MNNIVSPVFADVMLCLMYAVMAVALTVTAYSVWHGMSTRRKGEDIINGVPAGKIGWCVAIGLVACFAVTFMLGSSRPVVTNGVTFADPFWLKVTDMFIYTTVILIIVCFVSVIIGRFRS